MDHESNSYELEFQEYLERIFRKYGVEGVANSLTFLIGAFVVTVDGVIVAANDSFLKLLGYDKRELYGTDASKVTYSEDRNMVRKRISENNSESYILRLVNKQSDIKYVIVSPCPIEIDGITYRLAEFLDQTELMTLQEQRISALKSTAFALANTIERRDPYTHGHMKRTAMIAVEIARLLSLDDESIEYISLGSNVHDIGKISIPLEVLIKPGKLERFEWEYIRSHPEIGCDILRDVELVDLVKKIVLLHHECQDGSGYPNGLCRDEIPIEVSIVTVADCLEAIAGVRPYRRANSFIDSIEIMKGEASKFHPEALAAAESLVISGRLEGKEFGMYQSTDKHSLPPDQ